MLFKVLETDEIFETVDEVLDFCIEDDYHDDDDYFEEWVNDMYQGIEIAGTYYHAYDILENADDGSLDDLRNDFCRESNDNDREEAEYEFRNCNIGDTIYIQRYTVEVIENGDYDGDEAFDTVAMDKLRLEIEAQKVENVEEKKNEIDIMSLFQHIGG